MNMSWFESIIFGLFSGITEFLPVSSAAHQQIMMQLFGVDVQDPVRNLFIHVAMLIAVITTNRSFLDLIKQSSTSRYRHSHSTHQNAHAYYDWQLVRKSAIPMIVCFILIRTVWKFENLFAVALLLLINGMIVFLPERMVQGNKDARLMSKFDSLLIGATSALSAFGGISRIGCTYGVSLMRGADKKRAFLWALLLSIWALPVIIFFDIVALFSTSVNFWVNLLPYILSGITAYLGSRAGISVMRHFIQSNYSGFAYYCWGASLFSFIVYLTVG